MGADLRMRHVEDRVVGCFYKRHIAWTSVAKAHGNCDIHTADQNKREVAGNIDVNRNWTSPPLELSYSPQNTQFSAGVGRADAVVGV